MGQEDVLIFLSRNDVLVSENRELISILKEVYIGRKLGCVKFA